MVLGLLVSGKFSSPNGEIMWVVAAALCFCLRVLYFNFSLNTLNISTSTIIYSLGFFVTIVGAVPFHQEQVLMHDYIAVILAVTAALTYGLKPG